MDLIHVDLTEKLIASIFRVYNTLGYGYQEKGYQKAFARELEVQKICYKRELYTNLTYLGKVIRRFFVDFLVDEKVVVELKVANAVYKQHLTQVLQYLQNNHVKLGLIFVITPTGVLIKRVINQKSVGSAVSAHP